MNERDASGECASGTIPRRPGRNRNGPYVGQMKQCFTMIQCGDPRFGRRRTAAQFGGAIAVLIQTFGPHAEDVVRWRGSSGWSSRKFLAGWNATAGQSCSDSLAPAWNSYQAARFGGGSEKKLFGYRECSFCQGRFQ